MWTSESNLFSDEFKNKAVEAIRKVRPTITVADVDKAIGRDEDIAFSVYACGRRWRDDEECFQSLVMLMSGALIRARGYSRMNQEEAKQIEALSLDLNDVRKAVMSAVWTDYYYAYEKEY